MTTPALFFAALFAGADLQFEATTASSVKPVVGTVALVNAGWAVSLDGAAIAAGELVELGQVGVDLPALPSGAHLLLANGDRWPGSIVEIANDQVRFAPSFGVTKEVTLPLSAVAAAWLTEGPFTDSPLPSDLELLTCKRSNDVVRLANRDALQGTLTGLSRETLQMEVNRSTTSVPRQRIVALAMASELTRLPKPKQAVARVVLVGGARITLTEAHLLDGRLVGKTVAGSEIRVLLGDVAALNIQGGRAVYLSELTPARYEHTPYLGVSYPYTVDRSVGGGVLRLGRDTFDRGIGLHSRSRLVYAVPAGATRLECYLGLDAETGRRGQVLASVQIDGKDALTPTEFTGAIPPRRIVLPIPAGAKEVALIVDFGGGGNVQDHVNWADARLVRVKS